MKWRKSHGFLSAMVEQSHPASAVPSKIGNLSNMTVWNISTFLIYFSRAITLLKGLSAPRNYKKSLLLQKLYFPSLPWKFHLENVTSLLLCPCSGGSVLSHQHGCSVFSPSVYPLGPKSSSAQKTAPCPITQSFLLTLGSCSSLSHLSSPHLHADVWQDNAPSYSGSSLALCHSWTCPLLSPCYFLLPWTRARTASLLAAPGQRTAATEVKGPKANQAWWLTFWSEKFQLKQLTDKGRWKCSLSWGVLGIFLLRLIESSSFHM